MDIKHYKITQSKLVLCDNIKSEVCLHLRVESVIDWTKLKQSILLRNSLTKGEPGQQTGMLKCPTIKILYTLRRRVPKKSVN